MSRHMSCALTIDAVRARTKTVTRRDPATWERTKPGEHLILVEKARGIPKGEHVVRLAEVEVVDVRVERLSALTPAEIKLEGVNVHMTPLDCPGRSRSAAAAQAPV